MKHTRRRFLTVSGLAIAATRCGTPAATDAGADARPDAPPPAPDATTGLDAPPFADAPPPLDAPPPDDDAAADTAAPPADAPVSDYTGLPVSGTDFPLGVMAGDVTATAAIVWTRYTGATPLALRVFELDGDRVARAVLDADVTPGPDGFTHVEVTGLRPGARHRYAFVVRPSPGAPPAARSPAGRFRAAIADDALEVVTFAGTACTHPARAPFPAMAHAGGRNDLDFFLHAGDHVYADNPSRAVTLEQYRAAYTRNWPASGMRALHTSTSLYETWDDHEIDNNFNPETVDATQLANARRAFFEHRPVRRSASAPDRIWRSFRWGRTLELFVLDARGERRPSTRSTAAAQYLSREQMDWLKAGLMGSTAVFKFVLNSVPITNFPFAFDFGANDRWEGYAAQRREVLDFIASNGVRGVWWLSGDFHLGTVGTLEPSGPDARMREVLLGPGGSENPNPLALTIGAPQWDFVTTEHNYTVLRADPMAGTVEVSFVNAAGRVLFARTYSAPA